MKESTAYTRFPKVDRPCIMLLNILGLCIGTLEFALIFSIVRIPYIEKDIVDNYWLNINNADSDQTGSRGSTLYILSNA